MSQDAQRTAPHEYVPIGVPTWRTCALCGAGANARIHRIHEDHDR